MMATPITGTRLDEKTERRFAVSVERRGMSRSDWLREVITNALDAETHAADQAPTFADMAKRLAVLEGHLRETRKVAAENLHAVNDLSNTLAVERAADRAVLQQVYRMALRAAYMGVKSLAEGVPEEKREDRFAQLCDEADAVYEEDGLLRLEDEMRNAREELRQTIDRGGLS